MVAWTSLMLWNIKWQFWLTFWGWCLVCSMNLFWCLHKNCARRLICRFWDGQPFKIVSSHVKVCSIIARARWFNIYAFKKLRLFIVDVLNVQNSLSIPRFRQTKILISLKIQAAIWVAESNLFYGLCWMLKAIDGALS